MNYYAEAMAQEIQMSAGMGVLTGLGEERVAYVCRNDLAAAAASAALAQDNQSSVGAPQYAPHVRGVSLLWRL